MHPDAWLVVIDPQRIFADAASQWGSPMFPDIVEPVRRLASAAGERTVVTRWVPAPEPQGSWAAYLDAWPFADVPEGDPLLEVVPELAGLGSEVVSLPTFGKWGDALREALAGSQDVVLAGVSTDCCVLSTALGAADAGVRVRVAADACAGLSDADHQRALDAMALYAPLIEITDSAGVLDGLR